MEDFQFQRRGAPAAVAPLPGRVAAGGRGRPPACYEEVFGGGYAPAAASPLVSALPEEYREIFGAAAACSIPVLDLPPPGDGCGGDLELRQCSALDYLDIFGGFGDGDFAVSYDQLFGSGGGNGIGAPLPSELGNTSNSRGVGGMECEKLEMPITGVILERPSGGQVGFSLDGYTHHLNDDTNQLKRSNNMASWNNKHDPVNGTIHKNQVQAVPGIAFVVKNTEVDEPHTQVDIGAFSDSNCSKGTSEQQHVMKSVLSASSCSELKDSENDMKDGQRSSLLVFSGSAIATYEQNPHCSSKNQSTVSRSNGFSGKGSNNLSLHENFIQKKNEGNSQNKTVPTVTSASSGNDLKVKCTASEDVPVNEEHLSCSSNGHSMSSGAKSSPDHLTDGIGFDAVNASITEANHLKKSMSASPPCSSSQSTEKEKMAEQEKSNSMSSHPTNASIDKSQHSRSSSTHSISSMDQSYPDGAFLTVSDINLRTQPSRGPPPARPPPARPPSKFGLGERNLRRTLTGYQKHDAGSGIAYKSHSFKQAVRNGSPPPFDVEVDASSAAAASVAAIKEAMELAQARLKSAKVSMERKKDNLQSRRKLGLNDKLGGINRDEDETFQENQRIREEVVAQIACGKADGKGNDFAEERMATAFSASKLTVDLRGTEKNHGSTKESLQVMHCGEAGLSNLANEEDRVGEWKVEEQFFEFIRSRKMFKKVPENSMNEVSDKISNERIDVGEEPNASELKKNGNLLAAPPNVVEWVGDSNKLQDPSLTSKDQIKDSQEATLGPHMLGACNHKLKETVNAQHEGKKLQEARELLENEQEAKWRMSEEAFICELSEKNLRVHNDLPKCQTVYENQRQQKIQGVSAETCGYEVTEKEINVAEYLKVREEENDNRVCGKLSELDVNSEAEVSHISHGFAEGMHLKTVKYCKDDNLKMSTKADEYACSPEGQEIEPKEARLLFVQDKRRMPTVTPQAFEWAENEDKLKAAPKVHDWKDTGENFDVVQETNVSSGKALKGIKKISIETEKEFQLKVAKQNTSSTAGVVDDFEGNITAAQEDCKKKINENIKEVHVVVDSDKVVKSAQDVCKGIGDDKKTGNAQQSSFFGEQRHAHKFAEDSSDKRDAGWPVGTDSKGHEAGDVNEEKMKSEQAINVEEEKEREARKLEEKKRERTKLEEEGEEERIELEEEKEREKIIEEAKVREWRKLSEEKERERKLEEEKQRERRKLEEERERERRLQEEKQELERKKLEEEKEKKKLEKEEREKKKLEEQERERKKLEEEMERMKLEEERVRRMLEEERERSKLEEEKRRKMEEERERRKLEEERERREMEEKERKRKKQEEEDRERSKLEEKERERRKQEEEERLRSEEIEMERRKLEDKVRERRRIDEERDRKLEEEKMRERRKIEEEKLREKELEEEREWRRLEEEKLTERRKLEEKERERIKLEEERDREREREKDRQAVERATREAHERAFAEARERAERVAVERVSAEARQRALAEARERAEKASAEVLEKSMAEKVSREARLRAERAAVERATAEARERAVEKAIAEKAAQEAKERAEKHAATSRDGVKQNAGFSNLQDFDPQLQNVGASNSYQRYSDSSHHASFAGEKFGGSEGESAIRCKARMERHQRTVERAAKALAEKNLRDIIAQREQTERNRLAETLDADVKRWSNGKEGNLRALISTLQYILGPESGWQPIPLTDVVTAPAVKKAYRKATLCVHPDKLQQRGASIQQKYICEKVFDLLKEAWNKFNSEER